VRGGRAGGVRVAVAVPTRGRPAYLDVALGSLTGQVEAARAELVVVDDGPDAATRAVALRHGAGYVAHPSSRGLNAARNTALAAVPEAELVAFVDDDVAVRPGWLAALVAGAGRYDEHDVFTGPIHARFEGHRVPLCGREGPPVTSLWLGDRDVDAPHGWGANMAVRRRAVERVGPFDEALGLYGDEQEWPARLFAAGGRIRYLAAAALDHRRAGDDARVSALARAARWRGRASRRYDVAKGTAPPLAGELRVLAGCVVHGPRFRCANGPILTAHTWGRIEEWARPSPAETTEDFLSGLSGHVAGRRGELAARADALLDRAWRRGPSGRSAPRRRVLVVGIERPGRALSPELRRSAVHDVRVATGPPGAAGKFENLNALLAREPEGIPPARDWLVVADDDVELPPGFLDRFLAVCERFDLRIAQPAHRLHSHAAWPVTRRRPLALARETSFVEIGPVTAFHASTFAALLPFPALRMGWGLDVHWAALARERGWPIGVVDATPVLHTVPVAQTYPRPDAVAEARAFLAGRPYVPRAEVRTLRTHR